MSVGSFLGTTKGKAVSIGGGVVIAVGIAVAVLMQGDGYRSISVEQVSGTVSIAGEKNNGQAYVGQHLYSGDDVTVADASELTMCMDNDKYVYADANTHFSLQASAPNDDSKIKIYLDAGSELNVLQSALGANDSYEVDTPNSTMSVRGTTFRVTVYVAADGLKYTLLEVTEGQVLCRLKTEDGTYNGVERIFTAGQSALIRGNYEFSEFVTSGMLDADDLNNGDKDEDVLMLAYNALPKGGMERLIALLENGGFIDSGDDKDNDTDGANTEVGAVPTPTPTPTPEPEEQVTDNGDTQTGDEGDRPEPVRSLRDTIRQGAMAYVVSTDAETGIMTLTNGEEFDPAFYARENPDAVANFGSDPESLLTHYLIFGQNENRPPSLRAALEQEETLRQFAAALEEGTEDTSGTSSGSNSSGSSSSGSGSSGSGSGGSGSGGGSGNGGNFNPTTGKVTLPGGAVADYIDGRLDLPNGSSLDLPFIITDSDTGEQTTISHLEEIEWGSEDKDITVTAGGYMASTRQDQGRTRYTLTGPAGVDGYEGYEIGEFKEAIAGL